MSDSENQGAKYSILFMAGVEGDSAYINDTRVAGPKPWDGGKVKWEGQVRVSDLIYAVPELQALEATITTLKAQLVAAEGKAAAVVGALSWSLDVLEETEEMLRIATKGFSDTLPHVETDRGKSLARRLLIGEASASGNEWQAYALSAPASGTGSEEKQDAS